MATKKPQARIEKKKANKAFSDYIRERDGWRCYTCGKACDKYTADAGHLISRYWSATLYDEDNVKCQCKGCNILHENDPEIFKAKWIDEYGEDAYWNMYRRSKVLTKRTAMDYIAIREEYEEKLREIKEAESEMD